MPDHKEFSLNSKYTQTEGTIILSGIQALVRLPIDQYLADSRQGLKTGTLISGYRGSPLGGIDLTLQQNEALLKAHNVVFMPGVNEDLAATAIMGSQLANIMPQPKYEGVVGMWYGKGPGVDRTGDIFKHAQVTGVGRYGGVLAVAGDDPAAKSSTIPSHSEVAFYDAQMPVLFPGNVQEILDMGRLGFELSRYCGSWVGFKIVTNVADEFSTAEVSPERVSIVQPEFIYQGRPWQHTQNPALLPPHSLNQEREIYEGRLEAARLWGAANQVNRITIPTQDAWLGIAAAGKTYYDLREALHQLDLDDAALEQHGIRLLKIGMLYPIEPSVVRKFARGLEEILVIEEKRAFIERFLRDSLYDLPDRPRIIGKRDEAGNVLVRKDYELDADQLIDLLAKRLKRRLPPEPIDARLTTLRGPEQSLLLNLFSAEQTVSRSPYFCSGCPHNRSTTVPADALQGGGIGCHTMTLFMDRNITGITQMGGEGVQWVGAAPFSNVNHIFQNIGDGTLFHSGSLAFRQALTTGANMTYKVLYNGAVAMTGGQQADGEIPVPDLTRLFELEGVRRTIVVSSDPDQYGAEVQWAKNAEVWPRDRFDEAQQTLREVPGITALVYDQPCAAELRRKRRRGLAADPARRVFINEAVCEGCGDCGVKSNCLSVAPVETEFGRKTQIHHSSCNKDYTCLEGDCPAFITLIPTETQTGGAPKPLRDIYQIDREFPAPTLKVPANASLYLMGIGGTGVVTVNQILGTAAMLDGKQVRSLNQTGLSQKGGPVATSLKLFDEQVDASNIVGGGSADTYLVFDILNGTIPQNLKRAHPDKTIAVVSSSEVPTGSMVCSTEVRFPNRGHLLQMIEARTLSADNIYLDAIGLSEHLFGSHLQANMITIGAAFQAGTIPISGKAIERAITLNGVAVEANLNAFRTGRLLVVDPKWANTLPLTRPGDLSTPPLITSPAQALIDEVPATGELRRLLEIRVPELIAYQNTRYARQYVAFVKQVYEAEQAAMSGKTALSEAVARYLFKLMAYKDEYEVARLYLKPAFAAAVEAQFGSDAAITYWLHPPFLRRAGLKKKLKLGRWFEPIFRLLTRMRHLRGTLLDPFGYAAIRRLERALIVEYRLLIEEALATLGANSYEQAIQLAELPDLIRGYEDVKIRNVARFRTEISKLKSTSLSVETPEEELILRGANKSLAIP